MAASINRAGWQHPALFLLVPVATTPSQPRWPRQRAGLKSRIAIPISLAMHSQAVIRLKRGK